MEQDILLAMDRNIHRPIPTKSGFRRFTALLSQNDIEDDDIYSINEDFIGFVPSSQTMNGTFSSDISQNIERENEDTIPCTPFEQQSKFKRKHLWLLLHRKEGHDGPFRTP